jgi:AraC-like DNA-binding protein
MTHTDNHLSVTAPVSAQELVRDVTIHSPRTRMRGVKAQNADPRPWLDDFPVNPALTQYRIIHIGIMEAAAPTKIVRTKQTTAYFLATFAGKGEVLIDGEWRQCEAGSACLLPAHTLNAFSTVRGQNWQFCWVCYQQREDQRCITTPASPVLAAYDAQPLHSAITGLLYETRAGCQPSVVHHWVELIQTYVLRFAQPTGEDGCLRGLWDRVAAALAEDWNLKRLTVESGYSREHLRRLCHSALGRGPMHQVTNLRMRRATELLTRTNQTIEAIALQVGYQNAFVFSNAFKKCIGWRPSEYRHVKRPSPKRSDASSLSADLRR